MSQWFPRLTSTYNTWSSGSGVINGGGVILWSGTGLGVAEVQVTSDLTVGVRRNATGTATLAGVGEIVIFTGRGAAVTLSSIGAIVTAAKKYVTAVAAVYAQGTILVSTGDVYPQIPQVVGTVRGVTSGKKVLRTPSGKPIFYNYFPRARSTFMVVHDCSTAEMQQVLTHYETMKYRPFLFTLASDSVTYTVQYVDVPTATPTEGDGRWHVETLLLEQ